MNDAARSSRKPGDSPQPYALHVRNVTAGALARLRDAGNTNATEEERLRLAALFHDLGKLMDENQAVLSAGKRMDSLPLPHEEASVAALLASGGNDPVPAILAWAHHRGLPDMAAEKMEKKNGYRFLRKDNLDLLARIDRELPTLLARHEANNLPGLKGLFSRIPYKQVSVRILLSCLVDADRTDAAEWDFGPATVSAPELRAGERLALLEKRIADLNVATEGDPAATECNRLRNSLFQAAKDSRNPGIACLSAPVGSGKTYAVTAHLLSVAEKDKLRRIFVVAPFTNLIDQTVKDLREVLTLPGEDPEEVVSACHHRVEFDDPALQRYSSDWQAPIVVTTAVNFFETMAAANATSLRKFHQVPRSGVFVDEAHAAMPVWYWKQAWVWVKVLAKDWGCRFVLGSGTLVRFWEMKALGLKLPKCGVPELAPEEVREALRRYEAGRIEVRSRSELMGEEDFAEWALGLPRPSIFVFNTVNNAARAAFGLRERLGAGQVEHLSTALAPKDRGVTIERVKTRLKSPSDRSWILCATSCVEAGLDFSFRSGGREAASLASLLQTDGRISRNGEYGRGAEIWNFSLKRTGAESGFSSNPGFEESVKVLERMLKGGKVSPDLATRAIEEELAQSVGQSAARKLIESVLKSESAEQYPEVEKLFRLIRTRSLTVIVDPGLLDRLERREWILPREIQQGAVSIFAGEEVEVNSQNDLDKVVPKRFRGFLKPLKYGNEQGIFTWNGLYDPFLGYMAQLLVSKNPDALLV